MGEAISGSLKRERRQRRSTACYTPKYAHGASITGTTSAPVKWYAAFSAHNWHGGAHFPNPIDQWVWDAKEFLKALEVK